MLKFYFQESLFAVGAGMHRTAETLNFDNFQWKIMTPYPNVRDVNSLKIVSYNRSFFMFGGYIDNQVTSDILSFKDDIWSKVGILKSKRNKFSVILNVDKVYVFGGQKKQKYELCTLSSTVNCEQDLSIDFEGSEEPVLFGVSKDGVCDLTFSNYESKETKELMIVSSKTFKQVDHFVTVQRTNYRTDKYFSRLFLTPRIVFF